MEALAVDILALRKTHVSEAAVTEQTAQKMVAEEDCSHLETELAAAECLDLGTAGVADTVLAKAENPVYALLSIKRRRMMRYKIFKNDMEINAIESDESFIQEYCAVNGYTYQEAPLQQGEPEASEEDSVWSELDAAYQEGVNTAYDS